MKLKGSSSVLLKRPFLAVFWTEKGSDSSVSGTTETATEAEAEAEDSKGRLR